MEEAVNFEVISSENQVRWNEIVKSFSEWDIYYLFEYARSMEIHGDGKAFLIYFYYENRDDLGITERSRLCYVVMKKDIGDDDKFSSILGKAQYYDLETPYGYGGFLMEGSWSGQSVVAFENKMLAYAQEEKIVSQFVRFHPIYRSEMFYAKMKNSKVKYLKDTIYMDTKPECEIMLQMDSKNRNMVRKAIKNGVTVFHDKGEYLGEFIKVYETTMKQNDASEYYHFERSYYEYLLENMKENIEFFYSVYKGKIIGAAIFLFNQKFMHYHLSGVYTEYRSLASTNLLLYEAARWASCQGIRLLHLGGGIEAEDSLFGFKKQFNKNGRLPFYVGRTIYDEEVYGKLLALRKQTDESFDECNQFMIQYRR